ncbi:Nn.00g010270.m01.CDS01 [Neocucurbitaria sp. VM-36]
MSLVVPVEEYFNERAVLPNPIHGRMAQVWVGDVEDQFIHETGIVVEGVLNMSNEYFDQKGRRKLEN